ncbi:MAG TPA: lasso peptide biosynthesis B2 protein, partial [Mycobacteriales bacterium]|nr:lasso peptide biosynthesis B2 protein [Mycobacteriales bacterium]
RGVVSLSRLRTAPTIRDKVRIVRWTLIPSPAKVRCVSVQRPSLVAGYAVYWRGLATSIGPAARFVVARRVASSNRLLLLETAVCLALARLAVGAVPFRWLTRALRQRVGETPSQDAAATVAQGERVAWALERMRRHLPWRGPCLAQALAGKYMLRRRGIASTLYLGVAKDGKTQLEAHAWLRSGELVVAGGENLERFTVIGTFS